MPLRKIDERKIKKNYKVIVQGIKHEGIADTFVEEEIFSIDDIQRINSKETQADKNREFIRLILQGPENGYQIFIKGLNEDEKAYGDLAKQIESTVVEEENDKPVTLEEWVGKDRLSPEKEKKCLSDLDMLHFSKAINPSKLQMIATYFGCSEADVQHMQYRHTHSSESACHELIQKWKNKNGHKSTGRLLLEKLFEAWSFDPSLVYDEHVRNAVDRL